jgi:hypothetical protein
VKGVQGQAHLLEVVLALRARGRGTHFLHCRDQQTDQDGYDGDHHQELDQRKCGSPPSTKQSHGFTLE